MPRIKRQNASTRRSIIDLLKQIGPKEASVLAARLGVTAMAVRQHLYELQEEKLVTYHDEPRAVGRPARIWRLTPAAEKLFPDAHAALSVRLVEAIQQTFGDKGIEQILAARTRQQVAAYKQRMAGRPTLRAQVEALADVRTEEGYMAEVLSQADGSFVLAEKHCAICAAATSCQKFCSSELEVFQRVLGPDVKVSRTEHILSGARQCTYLISEKS